MQQKRNHARKLRHYLVCLRQRARRRSLHVGQMAIKLGQMGKITLKKRAQHVHDGKVLARVGLGLIETRQSVNLKAPRAGTKRAIVEGIAKLENNLGSNNLSVKRNSPVIIKASYLKHVEPFTRFLNLFGCIVHAVDFVHRVVQLLDEAQLIKPRFEAFLHKWNLMQRVRKLFHISKWLAIILGQHGLRLNKVADHGGFLLGRAPLRKKSNPLHRDG